MKKKRYTEEQIIGFLREANAGVPVKGLCSKHGFSEASYYLWRSKFGRLAGERGCARSAAKEVVSAPARRDLVRWMTTR